MNDFICLAKSHKFEGLCIAGKLLADGKKWIRPVSAAGKGEIPKSQVILKNGKKLEVGNVIKLQTVENKPKNHQLENHLVSNGKWQYVKRFAGDYNSLLDKPKSIWSNGESSTNGKNDRISYNHAVKEKSSLLFIKVTDFELFTDSGKSDSKLRISFEYNRTKYTLRVTDEEFSNGDVMKKISTINVYPYIYLTVSLTQNFTGYCYKLAATIITPQRKKV